MPKLQHLRRSMARAALILVLQLCVSTQAQTCGSCPGGWRQAEPGRGRCFKRLTGGARTRIAAANACQAQHSATLPSITNAAERDALWLEAGGTLSGTTANLRVWTGLNKDANYNNNQVLTWEDGTTDFSYVNSAGITLDFDNAAHLCVRIVEEKDNWLDKECTDTFIGVCQLRLTGPCPTTTTESTVTTTSVIANTAGTSAPATTAEPPATTTDQAADISTSSFINDESSDLMATTAAPVINADSTSNLPGASPSSIVPSEEDMAAAQDAVDVLTPTLAVVIGSNVATAVAGSVSLSVGGGAVGGFGTSSVSAAGTAGPVGAIMLIGQVQEMTLLGRIGGKRSGSKGGVLPTFSEGLGWSTLDFGDFISLDPSADSSRRRTEGDECNWATGDKLVQRLLVMACVLAGTSLLRLSIQWCYFWCYDSWYKAFDFPTWEGPTLIVEFFAVCQVISKTMATGCIGWVVTSVSFLVVGPILFIALCTFYVWKYTMTGELANIQNEHWSFSEVGRRLGESRSCAQKCWVLWAAYWKASFREAWSANTEQARRWMWVFQMYRNKTYEYFSFSLSGTCIKNLVVYLLEDEWNAGFVLGIEIIQSLVFLFFEPYIDPSRNVINVVVKLINLLTIISVTCPFLMSSLPRIGFFSDLTAVYLSTVSAGILALSAFFGPLMHLIEILSRKVPVAVGQGSTTVWQVLKIQVRHFFKNCFLTRANTHFQKKDQSQADSNQNAEKPSFESPPQTYTEETVPTAVKIPVLKPLTSNFWDLRVELEEGRHSRIKGDWVEITRQNDGVMGQPFEPSDDHYHLRNVLPSAGRRVSISQFKQSTLVDPEQLSGQRPPQDLKARVTQRRRTSEEVAAIIDTIQDIALTPPLPPRSTVPALSAAPSPNSVMGPASLDGSYSTPGGRRRSLPWHYELGARPIDPSMLERRRQSLENSVPAPWVFSGKIMMG